MIENDTSHGIQQKETIQLSQLTNKRIHHTETKAEIPDAKSSCECFLMSLNKTRDVLYLSDHSDFHIVPDLGGDFDNLVDYHRYPSLGIWMRSFHVGVGWGVDNTALPLSLIHSTPHPRLNE